jgi:hypothetical protein
MVLQVRITADGAELIGVTKQAGQEMNKVEGAAAGLTKRLVGMATAYLSLRTAANLIAEFRAQERAVQKLDLVIGSMRGTTAGLSQQLQGLAAQLQREGVIGDEAILEGAGFLAVYGKITDEQLPRTMRVMTDLAAFMGKDVSSAARALGMAAEGGTEQLRRMGIVISDQVKNSGDFARILDAVEGKIGGANRKMAEGAGAWENLGLRIGESREELGKLLGTNPGILAWGSDFADVLDHLGRKLMELNIQTASAAELGKMLNASELDAQEREIQAKLKRNRDDYSSAMSSRLGRAVPSLLAGYLRAGEAIGALPQNAELEEQLRKIREARRLMMEQAPPATGGASGGGTGVPAIPPEVLGSYKDLVLEMYKQKALFGETGMAAKIRYEIEHGALAGLDAPKQNYLMTMGKELAAMEEAARLAKEEADALAELSDEIINLGDSIAEKQRREVEARNESFKSGFAALEQSLKTELELEHERHRDSLVTLAEAERQKLDHTLSWQALRERVEEEHQTRLKDLAKETNDEMSEFAKQAARNMQDAFGEFFFNAMNGEFDNLAGNFAKTLQRMAAELAASEVLKLLTGDMGETGKMGGWIGKGLSFLGSLWGGGGFGSVGASSTLAMPGAENVFAGFAHRGGIAGALTDQRLVPAALFAGAPRYHRGGLAGDEVPAILRRGEEVLTRADPRHRENGGGESVVVNLNIDARGADAGVEQRIRKIAREEIIPQAIQGATANTLGAMRRPRFA